MSENPQFVFCLCVGQNKLGPVISQNISAYPERPHRHLSSEVPLADVFIPSPEHASVICQVNRRLVFILQGVVVGSFYYDSFKHHSPISVDLPRIRHKQLLSMLITGAPSNEREMSGASPSDADTERIGTPTILGTGDVVV